MGPTRPSSSECCNTCKGCTSGDGIKFPFRAGRVDRSVNELFETLMLLSIKAQKLEKIPFIWFWPDGAPSSAIMTHDVETKTGRDFCETIMDINDAYGIQASFQVVPERRYDVPIAFLDSLTKREIPGRRAGSQS